jgi:hypothetical protein
MNSTNPLGANYGLGILVATKELVIRETAAPHLHGIPAQQNATAISRLYDHLNRLHLARIEGGQR